MKLLLKIILLPVSLILVILSAFLKFLLGVGKIFLYALMFLFVACGVVFIFTQEYSGALLMFVFGFVFSPQGFPKLAGIMIEFLGDLGKRIGSI